MGSRPTYEELEQSVQRLESESRQRLRAERGLRRAEAMARALLNASADAAILTNAAGVIFSANETAFELLGRESGLLIRQNLYDLLPPDVVPQIKPRIDAVVRTGEPLQFEGDLKSRRFRHTVYPVFNRQGKVTKLAIYCRDISARRNAEEALRESEEMFRRISASAQDAIIMMDGSGNISYWNEAAERIFGYAKSEVIGRPLHQLLVPRRYRQSFQKASTRFKQTGQGQAIGRTLELDALGRSGDEFPIELSLSSFKHKERWHALGIVRDISERRMAEKERLQKEKLMGVLEMAGAASHELNQPLQIVSGYAELLSESIIEDHPFLETIKTIKRQCDRLGDLTNKIMRITKYETVEYINGLKIIDIHAASRKSNPD
jgi:PAS domain S-box-containing protein